MREIDIARLSNALITAKGSVGRPKDLSE